MNELKAKYEHIRLNKITRKEWGLKLWACQNYKICTFLQYQSEQDNSLFNRIFPFCNYFSVWVHRENTTSKQLFCHFFLLYSCSIIFISIQCWTISCVMLDGTFFYALTWANTSLFFLPISLNIFTMYKSTTFTRLRGEEILTFLILFINYESFWSIDCSMIIFT